MKPKDFSLSAATPIEILDECNTRINSLKYREVIQISTVCGRPAIWYDPEQICVVRDTLSDAITEFATILFEKLEKYNLPYHQ